MENKVLATVNGKDITEFDVRSVIARMPREQQQSYFTPEGVSQVLDQLVSSELIYNYALSQELDKDEEFNAQLELVKKDILTQYSIHKVMSKVTAEQDEVKKFYDENRANFFEAETIRAKHILVATEDIVKEVVDKINGGMSFEEAVTNYSICPSKAQGGDLGFFTKGQMVPEFEEAAFALEIGVLSNPVKTQFGYHLIKVEEKKEAGIKSFEEVEPNITNKLVTDKQNKIFSELIRTLKSKYNVEYK
jgi:peptidyl-prolyl cis-trans isomerase C